MNGNTRTSLNPIDGRRRYAEIGALTPFFSRVLARMIIRRQTDLEAPHGKTQKENTAITDGTQRQHTRTTQRGTPQTATETDTRKTQKEHKRTQKKRQEEHNSNTGGAHVTHSADTKRNTC